MVNIILAKPMFDKIFKFNLGRYYLLRKLRIKWIDLNDISNLKVILSIKYFITN